MRNLIFLFVFLIAGCDQRLDQAMEKLAGLENSVVLAKEPLLLDSKGISFHSAEPMMVVGKSSWLCLVLKTGVPLTTPQPEMDKLFGSSLHGAKVTALLKLKNGDSFTISQPEQDWSKYGHISSSEELSDCLSCACGPKPAIGSQVSEVSVNSSEPLKVLGVYWKSTNAY